MSYQITASTLLDSERVEHEFAEKAQDPRVAAIHIEIAEVYARLASQRVPTMKPTLRQ